MQYKFIQKSEKNQKPCVQKWAKAARDGKMDRREFLALATCFGATTFAAYGMLGLAAPSSLLANEAPQKGGILKISSHVRKLVDPRLFDWPQQGNMARQFLEPLVK